MLLSLDACHSLDGGAGGTVSHTLPVSVQHEQVLCDCTSFITYFNPKSIHLPLTLFRSISFLSFFLSFSRRQSNPLSAKPPLSSSLDILVVHLWKLLHILLTLLILKVLTKCWLHSCHITNLLSLKIIFYFSPSVKIYIVLSSLVMFFHGRKCLNLALHTNLSAKHSKNATQERLIKCIVNKSFVNTVSIKMLVVTSVKDNIPPPQAAQL